jgi:hypothetical protein
MNKLSRFIPLGALLLGLTLVSLGVGMWVKTEYGVESRFFTIPLRIPGKSHYSTWGVAGGPPAIEPDEWHFRIIFAANGTAHVILSWNMNERILYERSSAKIDEVFNVTLPRTNEAWTWDWVIENPNNFVLRVENFTVVHYPIIFPERIVGALSIGTGFMVMVAVPIIMIYLRHVNNPRK